MGVLSLLSAGIVTATVAHAGQDLAAKAHVSIDQARAIALKAVPGQIADEGLGREAGGSGLRYSFDVKRGAKVYEVGVDARSGIILERRVEGRHPD